jgi:hypothetical protein
MNFKLKILWFRHQNISITIDSPGLILSIGIIPEVIKCR